MRKFHLFLFAMFMFLGMVPNLAKAETLTESVERQEKQAKIDREKIPVFAVSVEALNDRTRKFEGMSPELITRARETWEGSTIYPEVKVGESTVTVEKKNGFVTFTINPSAMSEPDECGATYHTWRPDPIKDLIGWVHGAHTNGIVYAKGKSTALGVPSFQTCMGITFYGEITDTDGLSDACKRFGLDDVSTAKMMKSVEDLTSERDFLVYLVANYGNNGVLYRKPLEKALEGHMDRIRSLIKGTEEKTGYITYNSSSGSYQATTGHMLRADVHNMDSTIAPNGRVKVAIHVYSERVANVSVELQYEDGTAIAKTAIGNMATATFTRTDLVAPEGSVSGFEIVEIRLPETLKLGKIQIIAKAVDTKGDLIVRGEPIGTFEYAMK